MDEQLIEGGPVQGSRKQDVEHLARCYKMLRRARVPDKRWRNRAQEGVDFYFGKQWKEEDRKKLEKRKQPVVTINRVKPTIRLIHGLVVSQPVDLLAKPVGKNDDSVANTGTAVLKYVNNVNDYKTLRERVYFDALTYGVGVALAGLYVKTKDKRSEAVQNRRIDPREWRLDPQSQEMDISDARFCIWSRKVDVEDAQAMAKTKQQKHAIAKMAGQGGNLKTDDIETWDGVPDGTTPPVDLWKDITEEYANWNQAGKEDAAGVKQVVIHELWERYDETVWLYEHADGVPCEFDGDNEDERIALQMDPSVTAIYQDTVKKVRYYVFCGPVLLVSAPSPYDHDRLPFVPCFNERDSEGDPVSYVESIKDPQREINHRRSKALHDLNARPMRITQEAMIQTGLDLDQVKDHASDPNAIWVGPDGSVNYLDKGDNTGAQLDLYQDAKQEIQSVSGANDDLMGYDSSSKSGKAKQIQMDQGQMMMRPTEANLRLFDKLMAELNLQLVQQAHTEEWTIRIKDELGRDKFITVNEKSLDPETGMERKMNSIDGIRFEVEIDAMPWTPTLRQRSSDMIAQMANNEQDPVVRLALTRAALQVSDMPEKDKILDILDGAVQQMMAPPPMPGPGMPPPEGPMPPPPVPESPMPPDAAMMPPEMLPPVA